jgi:hypothetical protein
VAPVCPFCGASDSWTALGVTTCHACAHSWTDGAPDYDGANRAGYADGRDGRPNRRAEIFAPDLADAYADGYADGAFARESDAHGADWDGS